MIKQYHVSKNLFSKDRDLYQQNSKYDSSGTVTEDSNANIYKITDATFPNTYTISLSETSTSTTICRVVGFKSGALVDVIASSTLANLPLTFSTTTDYDEIRFSIRKSVVNNLMINVGNQAQPYEPYGNIWNEIPYNIYGTGETTLSTFPATIYTDGTDATAYKIYGNLVQSSNPTTGTSPNIYPPIDDDSINRGRWGTNASGGLYGEPCYNTSRTWQGLCNAIYLDVGTYTFSIYMKAEEVTSDVRLYIQGNSSYTPSYTPFAETTNNRTDCDVTTSYRRFTSTFEVTTAGYVYPRVEKAVDSGVNIYVTCFQLESGSIATAYSAYGTSVIIPVYPSETGDIRNNWFNQDEFRLVQVTESAYRYGTIVGVLPSGEYTFNAVKNTANDIYLTKELGGVYTYETISSLPFNFTADGTTRYIIRTTDSSGTTWADFGYTDMIINSGDTAIPYEPYGFKLPVVSGGTTTDVYLNEPIRAIDSYADYKSESAEHRVIKKLVLTGQENWYAHATQNNLYVLAVTDYLFANTMASICSHYTTQVATSASSIPDKKLAFYYNPGSPSTRLMYIKDTDFADLTDFKTYLTDQYNAGNPITVWYVLATPTTTSISGPTIPMTTDANTFNVSTTLTPSRADITYHGWHPQATTAREYTEVSKSITSLPSTIHADGNSLESFKIYGNLSQSGTPTPASPIYPSETGDITVNLWSYNPSTSRNGVTLSYDGQKINFSGTCTASDNIETYITLPAGTYFIAANANRVPVTDTTYCILIYKAGVVECGISNQNAVAQSKTFTLANDEDNVKMRIRIQSGVNYDGFYIQPMMNIGSAILPFEPYNRYKLPVQCGGVTTPLYTAESIRQIGDNVDYKSENVEYRVIAKLVFDGTETSWRQTGGFFYNDSIQPDYIRDLTNPICVCSHYEARKSVGQGADVPEGQCAFYGYSSVQRFYIKDSNYSDVTAFKTFLQQQYSAGTPVTVWYVLATPTTESISAPSIPTSTQEATIDVDTTLKPSKLDITYKSWYDTN